MNRISFPLQLLGPIVALLLLGCSTDSYRLSADHDVQKILTDRKLPTLGYSPDTTIVTTKPQSPVPGQAYAAIPYTPIVPPQPSPIEPTVYRIPFAPLGPEIKWIRDWPAPDPGPTASLEAIAREGQKPLQLGPPSPFTQITRLDLFKSLHFGIQHSRQYQDQLESLYESTLNVTLQHHLLLEPQPTASVSAEYNGGQKDVDLRSALTATANLGVTQPLPYGGNISATALVQFVDALDNQAINPATAEQAGFETSAFTLSGNLPLLRGAGTVNLEPLIGAQRALIYQLRNFEDYRRGFVVNVASQYFRLLTRLQAVSDRRLNYRDAQNTLEQTTALFAANKLNFLEVQRALQSVLDDQTQLIDAQVTYEESVDTFKLLLGMPVDQELEIVPVELEVTVPTADATAAISLAEKYRLDLQTARDQIEDARRGIANAENGLLPDLNLNAGASVGNRLDTPAKEVDSRTLGYYGGVTLNLPIDRLAQRNTYRTALINFAQAQRSLIDQTENVKSAVRDSLRQIHAAQVNLEISRRGVDLAQRRLEYSTQLLRLGEVTSSRDLVEAQEALLSAQDDFEQAKSDLQVNVLQFLQNTGTLRVDPHAGTLGQVLNEDDTPAPTALTGG